MHKKIAVVQTIFCPTRKMLNFQLSSLKSFSEYLNSYPRSDIDIIFAGYVDEEYYAELVTALKKYFYKKCKFIRFKKNYGKAYIVNDVLREYFINNTTTEYVFTFDSDICFYTDQGDIIKRLLIIYNTGKKIGLIACNFTGDNAHWISKFERSKNINGETIVYQIGRAHV